MATTIGIGRTHGKNPKFLEKYGAVRAGFSLRQLSNQYSGPVIRVRRSSDNTEADFTETTINNGTLQTWVGTGADNGFVSIWYDQSGNANNAVQPVQSLQPKIINAGALVTDNGKPAILYADTGTNSLDLIAGLTNVRSLFSVRKYISAVGGWTFLYADSGGTASQGGEGAFHGDFTYWISPTLALARVRDGAHFLNGQSVVLQNTPKTSVTKLITIITTDDTKVGRLSKDRSNIDRSWRGTIQEVILYSSDVSNKRVDIETDINSYWGVY